eukprot:CAMPEP_0173231652 /NCGR_PEP_ID=MMETSP1142-20121109/8508_1 /TAXON_ID=483371 /ORGANISM="non described non described, Strain CCMP2298" /LENGTH=57 /DNA_ID=CAMNT_0014161043 /DNA_START=375 /DNA_END=545 /DNA_ORIENTATION=+
MKTPSPSFNRAISSPVRRRFKSLNCTPCAPPPSPEEGLPLTVIPDFSEQLRWERLPT